MAYRIAAIRMTLTDLQGHALIAGLLKVHFFRTIVQQLTPSTIFLPETLSIKW